MSPRLLGDVLINQSTLEKITIPLDERIEAGILIREEAVRLVEDLGGVIPSRILEHFGYRIELHGINPERAEVSRK